MPDYYPKEEEETVAMKLDVRALLADEGRVMPIDLDVSFTGADGGSAVIGDYTFEKPIHVVGRIVNQAGYLRLAVSLSTAYKTFCARCLAEVRGEFAFDFERTVSTRAQLADLDEAALDDYVLAEDGFIELDEVLLEFFELSLPYRTLCREDCRGLCPTCGKNLNEGACACDGREIDPRLAPLKKWLAEHGSDQ